LTSYLFNNYQRKPFELVSGKGVWVKDEQGKSYLDLTSGIGVTNLGHCQTDCESALLEQSHKIWHMPNLYNSQIQEIVAQKLGEKHHFLSYFCNSGAEANEAAIKLARKASGKSKIITCLESFHGRTYGAMSATGQKVIQTGFSPLVPDFQNIGFNNWQDLEQIDQSTAAVMLEVIQGEGGVILADKKWLQQLQKICWQKKVLLIIDEVQTGIGRTGTFYAFEQYDLDPDIITLAKGLANGIPVGAMLGKKKLAAAFGPGSHGTTFGGNKLALASANAVLDYFQENELLKEVQAKGAYLLQQLKKISSSKIQDIRGKGLMVGIELTFDQPVEKILTDLAEVGVLALYAGHNTLRLLPALTITKKELDFGIEKITQILTQEY